MGLYVFGICALFGAAALPAARVWKTAAGVGIDNVKYCLIAWNKTLYSIVHLIIFLGASGAAAADSFPVADGLAQCCHCCLLQLVQPSAPVSPLCNCSLWQTIMVQLHALRTWLPSVACMCLCLPLLCSWRASSCC